jgi:hypothetical protein
MEMMTILFYPSISKINKCSTCNKKDKFHLQKSKEEIDELMSKRLGLTFEDLCSYKFKSKHETFKKAMKRLLFESPKWEQIEDKIIIPALENIAYPDKNKFKRKTLVRYFSQVFAKGDIHRIQSVKYGYYHDATKWCERLQTKMPNIKLISIVNVNPFNTHPQHHNFWHINVVKDGKDHFAFMSFDKDFVTWV